MLVSCTEDCQNSSSLAKISSVSERKGSVFVVVVAVHELRLKIGRTHRSYLTQDPENVLVRRVRTEHKMCWSEGSIDLP